jgi:zinc protease
MTCMKPDLAKAIEVYADVVSNPSFPDAELASVKQRTLAAIESQDADWQAQAMRFFRKSYFGPSNSPYQFTTIGQKDVVSAATADQLRQWYNDRVLKGRRVLAIFGDVDLSQAQSLARQYFGAGEKVAIAAPTTAASDDVKPPEGSASINVRAVEVQKTEQPLAGVVIGFKSDSVIGHATNFPLNVVDTMTSGYGYPTGYLHEILRGRGLVYIVHAITMPGRNPQLPGTFLVYAGCDPRNVNEVVNIILENIARCQGTNDEMNSDWFTRSKLLINTGEAMDNETPAQQATTAALDELYGLGYDYHDKFAERINGVTIDEVRNVSRTKLRDAVVTVSTPAPELVEKKTGTREYKAFPPVDLTPRGVQHDAGQ